MVSYSLSREGRRWVLTSASTAEDIARLRRAAGRRLRAVRAPEADAAAAAEGEDRGESRDDDGEDGDELHLDGCL